MHGPSRARRFTLFHVSFSPLTSSVAKRSSKHVKTCAKKKNMAPADVIAMARSMVAELVRCLWQSA